MSQSYLPIKGMPDLASPEIETWQFVESSAHEVLKRYGVREVRTPILERQETFVRAVGDTTDIVQKEMYAFERGDTIMALRPEGTAGVLRYVASMGVEATDARLYYMGPMFRAERMQKGRYRQFGQLGVEIIGTPNPLADVEVMDLQRSLLEAWGVKDAVFELNTRGMPEDMEAVRSGLRDHLQPRLADLCGDCQRRFEANILRVLDCKNEACKGIVQTVPPMTDFMREESRAYLAEVEAGLERLQIPFKRNPLLVRGLDYYVNTVWEITSSALGAQNAVAGGGRYRMDVGDRLIDGVGFGIGLNRVVMILAEQDPGLVERLQPQIASLVGLGDEAFADNLRLAQQLRAAGVPCIMSLEPKSMKAQMKLANRKGAAFAVIRGETELANGTCQVKRMETGDQSEVSIEELESFLRTGMGLNS
ncbi:MAG: histidyl-tRNA synthetase [Kiritimatiellia bacterium]|jgi:histidyl-tRNA synthetase